MNSRATNLSPNAKPWAPYSGTPVHANGGGGNNNGNSRSHYTQYRGGGFNHRQSGGKVNNPQQRGTHPNHGGNNLWSQTPAPVDQKQQQPQQQQQAVQQQQYARVKFSPTAAKLFVGQLPFECTEERMGNLFSAYGTVEHIHILRDNNNRSRGAAFVTYSTVQEADTAIFTLHNRYRMLTNRAIQVSYAKNSPNISRFGACSALEVHESFPTNPVPDVAAAVRTQTNDF